MEVTKQLREKLERLPAHEAYIFQFYYKELFQETLQLIDVKVGSALHLRFLISESKRDQDLLSIHSQLEKLNFGTFVSQCKRMVVLAKESLKAGLNPDPHLPAVVRGKHPSIADNVVIGVSSSHVPKAPYTKGKFEWYDFDRRPTAGIVKVEAHRYLLPCVVDEEDLNYTWLAPDCLEVSMRYPDLINHPIELVELVTGENGEPVFHAQHEILRGFEKDLAPRRETKGVHKGSIMDPFVIKFECDQDPNFVALNSKLKGFDLIDAKYLSRKGKICEMKLLQIVTREKSEDEIREGTANAVDCSAVVLGMSKSTAPTGTFTPFSSPQSVPVPNNAPSNSQQTAFVAQQQHQQQALMKQQQALVQQQEAWKQKELAQQQAVVQQQEALKQKELEQQHQHQAILQQEKALRQALKQKELEQYHEQQAILQREEALRQHEQQQQQQQQTTQQEIEYLRRQLDSALMMTEEAKQASANMESAARTEVQAAHQARAQLETAATAAVMQAKGDANAIHQAATAAVMQAKIDAEIQAKLQIEQAMRNLQHHQGDNRGFHGADVKIRNDDDMSTLDGADGAVSVMSNMSALFSDH